MAVRYFTLMMGVLFVMAGLRGFIAPITQPIPLDAPPLTLDTSYGLLLGLFPINLVHQKNAGSRCLSFADFVQAWGGRAYFQSFDD